MITDGVIRPDPNADWINYDPWERFWSYRSGSATDEKPPYASLIELLDKFEWIEELDQIEPLLDSLDRHDEALVLEWCDNNGLLGVLPHQFLSGRWNDRHIVRSAQQFEHYEAVEGESDFVVWKEFSGRVNVKRDTLWLNKFFPEASASFPDFVYPAPLTDEFWKAYAEPLRTFFTAAKSFWDAEGFLSIVQQSFDPTSSTKNKKRIKKTSALSQIGVRGLNALVAVNQPALRSTPDGSLEQVWWSPSLIGQFAFMATLDFSEHRRFLRCDNCNALFVSAAWQAKYCTEKCRWAAQKRRQRKRKQTTKRHDNG